MITAYPNCLDNLVGISTLCDAEIPTSGVYLDYVLEGLTLTGSAHIAEERFVSGEQLLKQKIKQATDKIISKLKGIIAPEFRLNHQLDASVVGEYSDNWYDYLNHDVGCRISRRNGFIEPCCSESVKGLQEIAIARVHILANDTAPAVLKVDDGVYGYELFPVDLVAGKITTVDINLSCRSSEVAITLNSANLRLNKVKRGCNWLWDYDYWCWFGNSRKLRITGFDATTGERCYNNFGIIPECSLLCNFDSLFCTHKELLVYPIIYQTGIFILQEAMAGKRINQYTTMPVESAKELLGVWSHELNSRLKIAQTTLISVYRNQAKNNECVECTGLTYSMRY